MGFFRIAVFAASLVMVIYAGANLLGYTLDLNASEKENDQLASAAVVVIPQQTPAPVPEQKPGEPQPDDALPEPEATEASAPDEEVTPTEAPREVAPIRVDFKVLKQEYRDIIGWLYSPDTPINYPLMRSQNNLDYIRKLPNGTPNDAGSLFLDFRNKTNFLDGYSVIYGHNMKNDTMFGSLEEYREQEYYDAHKRLYLITEKASYRIDLVAGVLTAGSSDYYALPMNQEKAEQKVAEAIENSEFQAAVAPGSGATYVLLSTCSYEHDDARFLLVGMLTEIESA